MRNKYIEENTLCEEYGDRNNPTIVFLHGAYFIYSFGRQYSLADKFHIIVPHIRGYGNNANNVFEIESVCSELVDIISSLNKKVTLIGFSLGAQIAVKLVNEHEDLFNDAIFISPWIEKDDAEQEKVIQMNLKQFKVLKKKWFCRLIAMMNRLPRKQRKEFIKQMQNVKEETIRNSVINGIDFNSLSEFKNLSIPMIALAGDKEENAIKNSVVKLNQMNNKCKCLTFENAGHNIPTVFYKDLNNLIIDFISIVNRYKD